MVVLNNLTEKALLSLTSICNKAALHPNDEDYIKRVFKVLYQNGVELNPSEIAVWLKAHHWDDDPVKHTVKWSTTISTGGRVQLKNKAMLPSEEDIWLSLNA